MIDYALKFINGQNISIIGCKSTNGIGMAAFHDCDNVLLGHNFSETNGHAYLLENTKNVLAQSNRHVPFFRFSPCCIQIRKVLYER